VYHLHNLVMNVTRQEGSTDGSPKCVTPYATTGYTIAGLLAGSTTSPRDVPVEPACHPASLIECNVLMY